MSAIYDRFRGTASKLMASFGVPATITRTATATQSLADRAAGKASTSTTSTVQCLAVLGTRKDKAADNTIVTRTTARINVAIEIEDVLSIGARSYTVDAVDELNPDGGATAIIYVATLR